MLSLDGEALDSDYPSLEDSPLLPPPPEPPLPSPKIKSGAPKTSQHHLKKKSRSSKTVGQSESTSSSSSHRPKAKSQNLLSSLSPPLSASSGNTTSLQPTASSSTTKRGRKTGKEKIGKKDAGRSGRSKKLSGTRKGKLQSKVSVLVREGVSSTTGNSGKLGLDLLGPGGVVSGASGPSVVGGSIAVVFRRDNESRSPFLKPCSETLALPGRGKDPSKTGKQHNILGPLSSTNPSGLKSKKAKPSSATSTSSSASSPTSSLAAKRRRRPGKKPREKGINVDGSDSKGVNSNCSTVGGGWPGVATEIGIRSHVLLLNIFSVTALLFKMEEANIASRAKAQEFIQATSQNQSQPHPPLSSSSVSSQVPPPPSHAPPPGPTPAQFILHSSVPLVGCTKTPPSHLHPGLSMGGGCYLKKLHTQERAVEEVKLAIKPYYQRKDINKDEYKDILRKAVHKICHSRTGEINPVKVSNLVKLYVQRYKYFRKHGRKMDEEEKEDRESASMHSST
uniref:SR-related CTD-associated factor 1 n=1 Tax=Sinocyclocheilus anshuiensis TaxID=1608454 RepID=A0A671RE16_9TELE